MSENTGFGVHEWNKIWSYTEKIKFSVSFMGDSTQAGKTWAPAKYCYLFPLCA